MTQLPIQPICLYGPMTPNRSLLQASKIDTVPIRIAPRHVERTNAAGAAEPVLRGFRIEAVFCEVFFAFEALERGGRDFEAEVACQGLSWVVAGEEMVGRWKVRGDGRER